MNNWTTKVVDAGTVKEGTVKDVTFYATNSIPKITHLQSSCGCTTPVYSESTKTLQVQYKAATVSKHLRQTTKKMIVSQSITVTYENGEKDILSFNITVKI